VVNQGVGPAFVESAYVTLDSKPISNRLELMKKLFNDSLPSGSASFKGSDIERKLIGTGESVDIFKVTWSASDENIAAFRDLGNRWVLARDRLNVSMTICYCSVFDRCFVATGEYRPKPIDHCELPTEFFNEMLSDVQLLYLGSTNRRLRSYLRADL